MVRRWVAAALLTGVLVGCSDVAGDPAGTPSASAGAPGTPTGGAAEPAPTTATPSTTPTPKASPATPSPTPSPTARRTTSSVLAIPALRVRGLRVVPYNGTADDRPGTVIQDRGVAASPRGARGGVGPGEVGNFIVTAHRTTHGRPFGRVPQLKNGDHVLVTAGGVVYDYVIDQTMTISFRKPAELAQQNAAVPGRPGVAPTRAKITLSTCATPEDHAQGNYWKDALGNPEHRINKIGTLVATRPAS
ncbi:class E sortase [Kribbella sp. CA-253562]|uniref:class E sortase n=1 Tax=Kribbella sp. CA-253562 TaxID=3239942 RepID=UPI003D914E4C